MTNVNAQPESRIKAQVSRIGRLSRRTESRDSGGPRGPEASELEQAGPESGPSAGSESDRPDGDSSEAEPEPLPLDQVFEILKNSRRREALHYLNENGGEGSLSELAEHIAAIENDVSVAAITSSQRKRVYVGLYQCHLPKMDDMDIVDFEKNRGTVELGANAPQLEPYLDRSEDPDWSRLYLSVTVAGVGLFAVSVLGSAPFGLTATTVLVALLMVMSLCSGLHAYVERSSGGFRRSRSTGD